MIIMLDIRHSMSVKTTQTGFSRFPVLFDGKASINGMFLSVIDRNIKLLDAVSQRRCYAENAIIS